MSNGKPTFFPNELAAAKQALADLTALESSSDTKLVAGLVTAVTGIAGVAIAAGQLGTSIATFIRGGQAQGDSLQIEVTNYSSVPIVLYNYVPHHCNISSLPDPLPPGDTGLVLITSSSGNAFSNDTAVKLDFLIGTSASRWIQVSIKYAFTNVGNPGRWHLEAEVDGQPHEYPKRLELMGAMFEGKDGFPSFSFYTSPIETGTGRIELNFYTPGRSSQPPSLKDRVPGQPDQPA